MSDGRQHNGGKRAGAGRKLDAESLKSRGYWRKWFNTPASRQLAKKFCREDPSFYIALFKHTYPAPPQEVDLNAEIETPAGIEFRCYLSDGRALSTAALPVPAAGDRSSGE